MFEYMDKSAQDSQKRSFAQIGEECKNLATGGIVPRWTWIVARLKCGIYLKILEKSWHDGCVTFHDGWVNLLPRRINEQIVPRWSRNVARWWAFWNPKILSIKGRSDQKLGVRFWRPKQSIDGTRKPQNTQWISPNS
jgi:hypothetical protein